MDDALAVPPSQQDALIGRLTPRQIDVITHLAGGRSDKEAATLLSISVRAVRRRIAQARIRTGLENRIQLIVIYAMWQAARQ